MEGDLSIDLEDIRIRNPLPEEVKKNEMDSLKEEEIWRVRRERMNNAFAAARTGVGQDPAELYLAARRLENFMKGADADEFISMIERLADLPAILNLLELSRGSLLHIAARAGKDEVVRLLVDHVPDSLVAARNGWGDTPLHVAVKAKRSEATKMLIRRAGNHPSVEDKNRIRILRMKNKHGNTALHEAVLSNCFPLVCDLLKEDSELVYWENVEHKSPLYLALDADDSLKREVFFLLPIEPTKIQGLSPVHGAVLRSDYGLLAQILEKNKGLFAMTDSKDGNVFHFAAYMKRGRVFELLRPETEYLAQKRDKNGDLPIHIASKMGHVELIEKLHPVSELLNKRGQTILHVAAKYGQTSAIIYILRHPELGELINERDHAGNTALHLAAMHSQPAALATLMLDERINLNLLNHKCSTARDIARDQVARTIKSDRGITRMQLASVVLRSISTVSTDLMVSRPAVRDYVHGKVRSRKKIVQIDTWKDSINTRLVVATLVTTVTFAAGFAVPGGFNSSDTSSGMATMLDRKLFQAFAVCNTIAMFSSMIAVISLMLAQQADLEKARASFNYSKMLLTVALPAMSATFLTGVTLTVGKLPWLANTICYLGLVFLLIISCATWLQYRPPFQTHPRLIRLLTYWFLRLHICLWGGETYVWDDQEEAGEECWENMSSLGWEQQLNPDFEA